MVALLNKINWKNAGLKEAPDCIKKDGKYIRDAVVKNNRKFERLCKC